MKVGNRNLLLVSILIIVISSCSVSRKINKEATQILLQDSVISTGHIGISIYEPATDQYLYNYNATKYFVPASNTKLFSLYAGMKYLGDSLVGLRYTYNTNGSLYLFPSGDPTFLHPDFTVHPVFNFLKSVSKNEWKGIVLQSWKSKHLGYGWSWDDYSEDYMVERSGLPVYGNVITFKFDNDSLVARPYGKFDIIPSTEFDANEWAQFSGRSKAALPSKFSIKRLMPNNAFEFTRSADIFKSIQIPLHQGNELLNEILKDTLGYNEVNNFNFISKVEGTESNKLKIIYSQPSDSLFTPMMHNSDNFFAEQTLLMVSNEKLGYMNDEAIIDTLLNNDLKDIPQRPQWVDGSGLSRYNLFTPQNFIYILNKMKNKFGLDRMKRILPTGGEGTIKNYYKTDSGFIYVKTGTLSNQVALSGYLITNKNKLLIFSLLANNVNGSVTSVRRAFEKFLKELRKK